MTNLKEYQAEYRRKNKEKLRQKKLEKTNSEFEAKILRYYSESQVQKVKDYKPAFYNFKFKNFEGKYLIDKTGKKFIEKGFLSLFFGDLFLKGCEIAKGGEYIKICREKAMIKENSDIDLILRITESNKRGGRSRKFIFANCGTKIAINY